MVTVSAASTNKDGLGESRLWIDDSTDRTRLRAVGCRNLDEVTPRPSELVAQHRHKLAPARVENAAVQPRLVGTSFGGHRSDVQLLDNDGTVAIGVVVRDLVQDVGALSADLAVQLGYTNLGFFSVVRSFLPTRNDSLGSGNPESHHTEKVGVFDQATIAVCHEVNAPSVERHDRGNLRRDLLLDLARDRNEPLVNLLDKRARLGYSFETTVLDNAHGSKLRKVEPLSIQAPNLPVRFTERSKISVLALPSRLSGDLGKTSLPCLVQLHKQLSTNVAWNLCKPRQFSSQLSQLIDLVKRCQVFSIMPRMSESDQSLLKSQVPEESQSVLPPGKRRSLFFRRIDPKSKALATNHEHKYILVYGNRQQLSHGKTRSPQASRSFGLRAKIPQVHDRRSGIRDLARCLGESVCRLRERAAREQLRTKSRTPDGSLSSKGGPFDAGQLAQRSLSKASTGSSSTSSREKTLGCSFLVALILRSFVWWSTTRNRCPLRTIAMPDRLLLDLKDEVSARRQRR